MSSGPGAASIRNRAHWRDKWNEIIFGSDTPAGRFFDIVLLALIFLSVLSVVLESVRSIHEAHRSYFRTAEWIFTFIFTLEYAARLISARNAKQ